MSDTDTRPRPGDTLLIMLKAPRPGFVKTRLAAELGPERAAEVYRSMVESLLGKIHAAPPPWRVVIAYTPVDAGPEMETWIGPSTRRTPADAMFIPQSEGDLGRRLREAFDTCFSLGAEVTVAIGGDCADITPDELGAAFIGARQSRLSIGPARDGGYWLIGLAGRRYAFLDDAPWSEPNLFHWTLDRAKTLGLTPRILTTKCDVDTIEDLAGLEPPAPRSVESGEPML